MKILIKNGYIVNENKIFESDILVNGELIEKIDKNKINPEKLFVLNAFKQLNEFFSLKIFI